MTAADGQGAGHPTEPAGPGPGSEPGAGAGSALPVTFRPIVTRVVLVGTAIALLVVFSIVAVLMPHDGAAPWSTGDRITVVFTGLLIAAVLLLLARPKAVADAAGLTVVNLIVKRRLEWPQVVRVNLRSGDAWVHLDLSDGTTLAVMGIQPGLAKGRAVRDARRLSALAEELGEARGTTATGPR
ncbi:MAG: hypothetical protein QOF98_2600 [Streptomyces sp.]|nr:hypothetical protein [Streptomyces sp.]